MANYAIFDLHKITSNRSKL